MAVLVTCVRLVCQTGVSDWCVRLVCQTGVSEWCVRLVCQTGAGHMCQTGGGVSPLCSHATDAQRPAAQSSLGGVRAITAIITLHHTTVTTSPPWPRTVG